MSYALELTPTMVTFTKLVTLTQGRPFDDVQTAHNDRGVRCPLGEKSVAHPLAMLPHDCRYSRKRLHAHRKVSCLNSRVTTEQRMGRGAREFVLWCYCDRGNRGGSGHKSPGRLCRA